MTKLLRANFARLTKHGGFRSCMICMAFYGLFMIGTSYYLLCRTGHGILMENICFGYAGLMGFVAAAFISLFLGTEYSDGTIRNKLTAGHKRSAVYLANLMVNAVGVLAANAAYVAVLLLIGIPLFGPFRPTDSLELLTLAFLTVLMDLSWTAVFTLCSMLNPNKAAMTAVSILSALMLSLASGYIRSRLNEPKVFEPYTYVTDKGYEIHKEAEENPDYLEGTEREVYTFLNDFLPSGQELQILNHDRGRERQMALYSCLVTVLSTGSGIFIFKKKDIK